MQYPPDGINHEIFNFDIETARLKLALLKENFEYRKFYEKFIKSIENLGSYDSNFIFPRNIFENFGLIGARHVFGGPSHYELLKILNPFDDFEIEKNREKYLLQTIFYECAVMQIELNIDAPVNGLSGRAMPTLKKAKTYEQFFSVDLRKKKKQILREFEEYINNAYRWKKYNAVETWQVDDSRFRQEAWKHLTVWKLRRKKLSFSKIALETHQTADNAKKSFYRAFELILGRKYDPGILKREIWVIHKNEMQKTCDSCPDRLTCGTLCPDVIPFVDQDILPHSRDKLF